MYTQDLNMYMYVGRLRFFVGEMGESYMSLMVWLQVASR